MSDNGGKDDVAIADYLEIVERRLEYAASGQTTRSFVLDTTDNTRLDVILGQFPGIGLFRRANSLTAHPTTQGLTMRGVGANAAGRVLVTLDGVPQNDPFGGWVYWAALNAASVGDATIFSGGGSGAFGAQALAGALELRSAYARRGEGFVQGWYGSNDSLNVMGRTSFTADKLSVSLMAGYFETGGDFLFAEDQRGTIDVSAASDASFVAAQLALETRTVDIRGMLRYMKEERTNGLSLATNSTEAIDASLTLSGGADVDWELVTYYRTRDFANMFVSAREDRTVERPVLDQFDVPAWGAGFLARAQFEGLEFGVDGRRMNGETNERFRNLGAGFTRQRRAGGDQWILGVYGEYGNEVGDTAYSATFRMDRWRTFGGERVEANITDGNLVREDDIPDRGDWIWSGRVGLDQRLTGAIDLRAAAYKSWRLPTLNEYYRPFRVVNDITEANPSLLPEKLYGLEVGLDYHPLNTVQFSATLFRNWLNDGVGNVTIGFGPGFFSLGGFVPAGGVLRQRANIDRSITDGLELDGSLQLQSGWTLTARYLYARARVTRFDARPELVGKRPVQTPRHSATFAASYKGDKLGVNAELRLASNQYDDDLNTRLLDGIATVNIGVSYAVTKRASLTARAENLFDAKVVSAVTADGLETLAQQRFARIGIEIQF